MVIAVKLPVSPYPIIPLSPPYSHAANRSLAVTLLCVFKGIGHWQLISTPVLLLVLFCWRILVGFHGNDWRRTGLERRGFRMLDVVTGADDMSAARRFFDRITERS